MCVTSARVLESISQASAPRMVAPKEGAMEWLGGVGCRVWKGRKKLQTSLKQACNMPATTLQPRRNYGDAPVARACYYGDSVPGITACEMDAGSPLRARYSSVVPVIHRVGPGEGAQGRRRARPVQPWAGCPGRCPVPRLLFKVQVRRCWRHSRTRLRTSRVDILSHNCEVQVVHPDLAGAGQQETKGDFLG